MKMSELANKLLECLAHGAEDQEVRAYDPDGGDYYPVSSFTYGGENGTCDLYTDEP